MIHTTQIKMSDAGFDTYQLAPEGVEHVEFETAEEYVNYVVQNNYLVTAGAWDADIAEMGDEDGQLLAAAMRKASGAVQGGHKTLVAFLVSGEVQLESVEEDAAECVTASYTITNDFDGNLIARDNESGDVVAKIPSDTVVKHAKDSFSVVAEFGSNLVGDVESVEHDGEYIHVNVRIPAAIGINPEDVNG